MWNEKGASMARIDILLPTINRLHSLIFTLSGLANQTQKDFRLIVADQSPEPVEHVPVIATLRRIVEAHGNTVEWHYRFPSQGIAEQRAFLLDQAQADAILFLDDDVMMEPWVLARMLETLEQEGCGFVGAFPSGLSFRDDHRPTEEVIEFWDGPVQHEDVMPGSTAWSRAELHRAANLWHVTQRLSDGVRKLYKVAWVASCVLYDRRKLWDVGGFSFWSRLPRFHSGEDVLVQNLLMRRYGACAIIPSGTYHAEVPSTVLNPSGTVDGHALSLLDEMIDRYCREKENSL
jgi:glycosyltransferase involved in cell wall biosynthesis